MAAVVACSKPLAGLLLAIVLTMSAATIVSVSAQSSPSSPFVVNKGGDCCVAGYTANVTLGTTYTTISAEWNVPVATCQPRLGSAQQVVTMIQANVLTIGVRALCNQGSARPLLSAFAYFPPVDSSPVTLKLKVRGGDSIFAVIAINPSTSSVNGTLRDVSTSISVHYIKTVPGAGAAAQGFNMGVSRGGLGPFTTISLAKFKTPVQFEGCEFVSGANLIPLSGAPFLTRGAMIDFNNSLTLAKTSVLSAGGTAFIVSWVRSV